MRNFKYRVIKRLYFSNIITKILCNRYINKHEGGEFYSETLRKIFK